MTKVSIITPTHDRERFLPSIRRCVEAQDYPDWEWLILDAGPSPSKDLQVAQNPRIRYTHTQKRSSIGAKRNWTDSDDLCIMFKAAYTTDFYRAIRDALHAEVDSWNATADTRANSANVERLWDKVFELEPISRVADAFSFPKENSIGASAVIFPVEALTGRSV